MGWLQRWAPGLHGLLRYPRDWLGGDLVAGLMLSALLVPVGIKVAPPVKTFPSPI